MDNFDVVSAINSSAERQIAAIKSGASAQMAELSAVAYFIGLFISMGMNFSLDNGLGALLICWLSWLNVGYVIVDLLQVAVPK